MAELKITTNAGTLAAKFKQRSMILDPNDPAVHKHLLEIGVYLVDRIKSNAAKGINWDGSLFPPYSDDYADWKSQYGEGRQTARPDLTLTGAMMASVMPNVTNTGSVNVGAGAGGFALHADLMEKHVKGIGVPIRDPVGMTAKDRSRILELHHNFLIERMNAI